MEKRIAVELDIHRTNLSHYVSNFQKLINIKSCIINIHTLHIHIYKYLIIHTNISGYKMYVVGHTYIRTVYAYIHDGDVLT